MKKPPARLRRAGASASLKIPTIFPFVTAGTHLNLARLHQTDGAITAVLGLHAHRTCRIQRAHPELKKLTLRGDFLYGDPGTVPTIGTIGDPLGPGGRADYPGHRRWENCAILKADPASTWPTGGVLRQAITPWPRHCGPGPQIFLRRRPSFLLALIHRIVQLSRVSSNPILRELS